MPTSRLDADVSFGISGCGNYAVGDELGDEFFSGRFDGEGFGFFAEVGGNPAFDEVVSVGVLGVGVSFDNCDGEGEL